MLGGKEAAILRACRSTCRLPSLVPAPRRQHRQEGVSGLCGGERGWLYLGGSRRQRPPPEPRPRLDPDPEEGLLSVPAEPKTDLHFRRAEPRAAWREGCAVTWPGLLLLGQGEPRGDTDPPGPDIQ